MNTQNFLGLIKSVKVRESGVHILSIRTDKGDDVVVFAGKNISTVTTTITDENDNETEQVSERFTTGSCFDFSVVENKQGSVILDSDENPVLDDDNNPRTFKTDSLSLLSAQPISFQLFKDMVLMFK